MTDPSKLNRLIQLIQKIARSRRHVGLEIDWDGHVFHWRVVIGGLTADEWTPAEQETTVIPRDVDMSTRKH